VEDRCSGVKLGLWVWLGRDSYHGVAGGVPSGGAVALAFD